MKAEARERKFTYTVYRVETHEYDPSDIIRLAYFSDPAEAIKYSKKFNNCDGVEYIVGVSYLTD